MQGHAPASGVEFSRSYIDAMARAGVGPVHGRRPAGLAPGSYAPTRTPAGPPRPGERITHPFIVPRESSIEQRLVWLDQIIREASGSAKMKAAAAGIMAEAHRMALVTPSYRGQWFARIVALEALKFAHTVPYVAGPPGDDEFAPAEYTLENGGDCDRLGSMLAGLLCLSGLIARVDWLTQPGQALDHVSVEVALDDRWFWAEASVPGAMVGETPYEAVERRGAWHVMGKKSGNAASAPRTFAWDGWDELWHGWPVSWFQRYYPCLFRSDCRIEELQKHIRPASGPRRRER